MANDDCISYAFATEINSLKRMDCQVRKYFAEFFDDVCEYLEQKCVGTFRFLCPASRFLFITRAAGFKIFPTKNFNDQPLQ
jgi:hypothetical protein